MKYADEEFLKAKKAEEKEREQEKAYEFMKQFVINGRNMLDVFRERIAK